MSYILNRARRAWVLIFLVLPTMLIALTGMCLLEVWSLRLLIDVAGHSLDFAFLFVSSLLMLFFLSLTLAVLCLQLTEAARAAGLAETLVLLMLVLSYALIPRQQLIQPLIFLATGKIIVTVLFARFWHAKFRVFRMRYGVSPPPRYYLQSIRLFLSCKWVLLGSWFISILAFALALVVSQTFLAMQGWEGLGLLLTFFALFWIFVRNPHAHAE